MENPPAPEDKKKKKEKKKKPGLDRVQFVRKDPFK